MTQLKANKIAVVVTKLENFIEFGTHKKKLTEHPY